MCHQRQCHGAADCVGASHPRNFIKTGTAQISACSSVDEERRSSVFLLLWTCLQKVKTSPSLTPVFWRSNHESKPISFNALDQTLHVNNQVSCLSAVAHNVHICPLCMNARSAIHQNPRLLQKTRQSILPSTPFQTTTYWERSPQKWQASVVLPTSSNIQASHWPHWGS